MQARLSRSKTWTQFPPEFLLQVQNLVAETFEDYLIEDASIHMEGRIYPEEILFQLGLKTRGQLKQSNFEVSAQYQPESQNAKKIMHHCIEAAASMLAEYFDLEENENFPRQWTEFNFEGTSLFIQYTTENTDLEAEANRLLGLHADELVQEESSHDALDFTIEERIPSPADEEGASDIDDLNFEGDDFESDDEVEFSDDDDDDDDDNDDDETDGRHKDEDTGSKKTVRTVKKEKALH